MSTRSGKRIHSVIENDEIVGTLPKSERKTRNKGHKETETELITKPKKSKNYVSYPTDDEDGYTIANDPIQESKSTRKSKKNTLKEHNINVLDMDVEADTKKTTRITRQAKRFADIDDNEPNPEVNSEEPLPNGRSKSKKNKKNKSKNVEANENKEEFVQETIKIQSKKAHKKKKKKGKSNSFTERDKPKLNGSNLSTDSYHSAAGSPVMSDNHVDEPKGEIPVPKKLNVTVEDSAKLELNAKFEKDTKTKRRSSVKHESSDKVKELSVISEDIHSTYDKIDTQITEKLNSTFDKEPTKRKSSRSNISVTNTLKSETTENCNDKTEIPLRRQSLRSNNSSNIKSSDVISVSETSEKQTKPLNSTFDKSPQQLNTTFDKIDTKANSQKSSLISSDNSSTNLTYDKDDISRISITSDESKTENIVNTTPVLIESSMDESQISSVKKSNSILSPDLSAKTSIETLKPPVTPLKREGTFTKESPEMMVTVKTPTKRMSLPSPGCTPFQGTRSLQKETIVLNVTRSIEKSTSRSPLAEVGTRQTRVMFCSPMNNPAVVSQQKRKVIKSSLKGSNKSFVFEDSDVRMPRASARKRSLTLGDAPAPHAKRPRPAPRPHAPPAPAPAPAPRTQRPRTLSATANLDATPSTKLPTPGKSKADLKRTRLPNFAALHQKQFEKMESLDECQERKRNRARKLMTPRTPTGMVQVLERSSPKAAAEQLKPKETTKKAETPKKSDTFTNRIDSPRLSKLPTLESLRPGFTRFGFKMNTDSNPFSIPSEKKTEKPNGLAKLTKNRMLPTPAPVSSRMLPVPAPVLPSTKGATARKELAKQTVMREKSFTSLSGRRDGKRDENRTIIKGVRTNRRFELQMKMRNID